MKKITLIYIALLSFVMFSCSDDEKYTTFDAPTWSVDKAGYQEKPAWNISFAGSEDTPNWVYNMKSSDAAPSWQAAKYTFSMTAVVVLSDYLSRFETDKDEMAVFLNDECRGVATTRIIDDKKYYFIMIAGESTDKGKLSFKFYNDSLNHIYYCDDVVDFKLNTKYGSLEIPIVLPIDNTGKFPDIMYAHVTIPSNAKQHNDDVLAVFVDGECRGVGEASVNLNGEKVYSFEIGTKLNENPIIRFNYYNADLKIYYHVNQEIQFSKETSYGSLDNPIVLTIMPESSMWVYVQLPEELKKYQDVNNDMMAVFADNKCCGVAEIITNKENEVIYKILVKNISSSGKLDVRYYSSYNSYLFQMPSLIPFVPNGNYGSFDEPSNVPFNLETIYPFSMKAYFMLPDNLQKGVSSSDQFAVFCDNKCVGIGTAYQSNSKYCYMVDIIGSSVKNQSLHIKYYNSNSQYMYASESILHFTPDGIIGDRETPELIELINME